MAGTLIYKREVISGSPAVVDNVTGGDMRPVTSNAVNSALNGALAEKENNFTRIFHKASVNINELSFYGNTPLLVIATNIADATWMCGFYFDLRSNGLRHLFGNSYITFSNNNLYAGDGNTNWTFIPLY